MSISQLEVEQIRTVFNEALGRLQHDRSDHLLVAVHRLSADVDRFFVVLPRHEAELHGRHVRSHLGPANEQLLKQEQKLGSLSIFSQSSERNLGRQERGVSETVVVLIHVFRIAIPANHVGQDERVPEHGHE